MRVYTAHLRPIDPPGEAVLVKEGFSWPALFLGPFWALWHGLWAVALGWFAGALFVGLLADTWPRADSVFVIVFLALNLLFAAEANELRRRALVRRGWREAGIVGGLDHDAAVRRFADLSALDTRSA